MARQDIQQAIKRFNSGDLRQNALYLFQTLGYNTEREGGLDTPQYKALCETYDLQINEERAKVNEWTYVDVLFQLSQQEMSKQVSLFDIRQVDQTIIESYLFFTIELKESNYSRTDLSQITREINRCFAAPALILFKYGNNITLSVINRRLHKRKGVAASDILEKVTLIKDVLIDKTHRAHIEVFFDLSFEELKSKHNFSNFVELHNAWQKTLDTSELTKQFYKKLSAWYYYADSKIKLPNLSSSVSDEENRKQFLVRLIARMIFCWFLKEKNLIPQHLLELDGTPKKPLTNDADNPDFDKSSSYYLAILQNIFFKSLNEPIAERDLKAFFHPKLWHTGFLSTDFLKIPYLNGGIFDLFEGDKIPSVSDTVLIPNELFFAKDIVFQSGKTTIKTHGLNELLAHYKFTVAENTPLEEEVALDPELLGFVFESLLAELDPDESIAKNARKQSGSFYTPRKVIEYMVNESLFLYFKNFDKIKTPQYLDQFKALVYHNTVNANDRPFCQLIVDALDTLRVIDPACGSGAFPMGMLQRIVEILKTVDATNELWLDRQLQRVDSLHRDDFKRTLLTHLDDFPRKLGIIKNTIYGIDIQPLAIQITKLRFFISLLIEQNNISDDPLSNFGIMPMPNIETKIVCADSLRDVAPDLFATATIDKLKTAREQYYRPQISKTEKDKAINDIVEHLDDLYPKFYEQVGRKAVIGENLNRILLKQWFTQAAIAAPFFNLDAFFPEVGKSGFDIVIGNPPYGGEKISEELRKTLNIESKDPYGAFIARFLRDGQHPSPLKHGGVLAFIVSDTFMTIKSHRPLRAQMMDSYVHKMIRMHPDTFSAMVNTAIVVAERNVFPRNEKGILTKNFDTSHHCLMADMTNVDIHNDYSSFLTVLNETIDLSHVIAEGTVKATSQYAIYHYPQSLIATNSNLPFFVASPKLFALMNDQGTDLKKEKITIGNQEVEARRVTLNGNNISVVKLGQIADVKQGLATGDNDAYLFQNPLARGNYRSIEEYKQFLLTDEELDKIRDNEGFRLNIIENGINTDDADSERYFGGRYIIPYDKGGESDSNEGWLPNYYVPTDYFIDWTEWAVERMKTLTTKERNIIWGKQGGDKSICSRFQNVESMFVKGLTFSRTGMYAPTFRIKTDGGFDSKSNAMFIFNWESNLGFLASKTFKYLFKNFLCHTVQAEGDAIEEVILPNTKDEIKFLVNQIMVVL
jgi:type I restriction-modification system DNA methylase subunit